MAGKVINPTPFSHENQQHILWKIPATPGNVEAKFSAGKGFKIKPLYGSITLVTDATVANRNPNFKYYSKDDELIYQSNTIQTTITASQTKTAFLGNTPDTDESSTVLYNGQINLQGPLYERDKFAIVINNGVAGDSYTGYIRFLKAPVTRKFNE